MEINKENVKEFLTKEVSTLNWLDVINLVVTFTLLPFFNYWMIIPFLIIDGISWYLNKHK